MLNCICHSFLFLLWTIFFSCICSFLPLLLLPLLLFPKFLPRPIPFLFPFPLLLFSAVTNSTVELFRLWLLNSCSYDCPISPSKPHLSECGNHLNAPGPRSPPWRFPGPPTQARPPEPLGFGHFGPSGRGPAAHPAPCPMPQLLPPVPQGLSGPRPCADLCSLRVVAAPGPELTFSLIALFLLSHLHVRAALSRTASGLRRVGELCK